MVSQQIRVCFVDIICCIAESERPTMGFADAKCRTCRRIESLQCTHTLRCSRFEARLKFIFNAIVGKRSRVRSPWTNAKVCSFNNNDDEFCTKLNFRQWQSYWNERKTLIKKCAVFVLKLQPQRKPVCCLEKSASSCLRCCTKCKFLRYLENEEQRRISRKRFRSRDSCSNARESSLLDCWMCNRKFTVSLPSTKWSHVLGRQLT